jgi:hypothetical protein
MINPQPARPMITPRPVVAAPRPNAGPVQPAAPKPQHADAPIALAEDVEEVEEAPPASKIHFGPDITHRKHDWKRLTQTPGTGAVRMKSFHGKLSEQGMEYLDDAINTWLDAHPDIEVKFVTSSVGLFDGKMKDLALILNLWY